MRLKDIEQNQKIKYLPVPKLRFVWALLQFPLLRSASHQLGWFKSAWKNASVDRNGDPVPWLTYPAIHFLESKSAELKHAAVFEFGSGNSTLWWANKSKQVTSVEYFQKWYKKLGPNLPRNVEYIFADNNQSHDFADTILQTNKTYSVVVVDGRDRVRCALNASQKLTKNGVIIWDNSERERYQTGVKKLHKLGFKQIEFFGPVPIDNKLEITSIFYRNENIFGL